VITRFSPILIALADVLMAWFNCGLLWISWDFLVVLSLLCAYKDFDMRNISYVDSLVIYQVCR
jgi:hypothetical protein